MCATAQGWPASLLLQLCADPPVTACQALVQRLHARGQRWVPIVDPGIKIDPGYPAYDAGLALGVFIASADDGEPYVGQAGPSAWLLHALFNARAGVHLCVC